MSLLSYLITISIDKMSDTNKLTDRNIYVNTAYVASCLVLHTQSHMAESVKDLRADTSQRVCLKILNSCIKTYVHSCLNPLSSERKPMLKS